MKLSTQNSKSFDREPLPEELLDAVCSGVVGLGEQVTKFGVKDQVVLMFDFPGHTIDIAGEDLPRRLSATFTANISHDKAKLRQVLLKWIGKDALEEAEFDLFDLVGTPCRVLIEHYTKRDNTIGDGIGAIKAWPASNGNPPSLDVPGICYDAADHDQDSFDRLPEWLRQKVNRHTAPAAGTFDTGKVETIPGLPA